MSRYDDFFYRQKPDFPTAELTAEKEKPRISANIRKGMLRWRPGLRMVDWGI